MYESCRSGAIQLRGFPDYAPLIKALRDETAPKQDVTYKVCAARGEKLVILRSLARRWLEHETTKADAETMVREHNQKFSNDDGYLEDDERTYCICSFGLETGNCVVAIFHSNYIKILGEILYSPRILRVSSNTMNQCNHAIQCKHPLARHCASGQGKLRISARSKR